jgi:Transcriptional regulator, AbiEi antitoxin
MAGVPHETSNRWTERREPPFDIALGDLARRQHNVVSLTQLRALGLSASAVRSRAASGRLRRIHRGVYAVGHDRLTGEGCWMAAVLACGPDAALSHRSAAALWGLRPDNRAVSDVSLPRPSVRSRPEIIVHAAPTLRSADHPAAGDPLHHRRQDIARPRG